MDGAEWIRALISAISFRSSASRWARSGEPAQGIITEKHLDLKFCTGTEVSCSVRTRRVPVSPPLSSERQGRAPSGSYQKASRRAYAIGFPAPHIWLYSLGNIPLRCLKDIAILVQIASASVTRGSCYNRAPRGNSWDVVDSIVKQLKKERDRVEKQLKIDAALAAFPSVYRMFKTST